MGAIHIRTVQIILQKYIQKKVTLIRFKKKIMIFSILVFVNPAQKPPSFLPSREIEIQSHGYKTK